MSVIFICGVHGVGKSYLCTAVSNVLGIPHKIASELIKSRNISAVSANKIVTDVKGNQYLLLHAVNEELAKSNKIILDGHVTLKTKEGIECIPLSVFESLPLLVCIMISKPPELIYEQILKRDGVAPDIDEIELHQNKEMEQCLMIAEKVGVPCVVLDDPTVEDVVRFVNSYR